MVSDTRECIIGNHPTLGLLKATYGQLAPVIWLITHITELEEFCGCKNKLTQAQSETLATMIAQEYYYMKTSELMLFFFRFKNGHYGTFYGSIDPMVITNALLTFVVERRELCLKYEEEQAKAERERSKANTMTYKEYCERNNLQPKDYDLGRIGSNDEEKKTKYSEEQIKEQAMAIVNNTNGLDDLYIGRMRDFFIKTHGKTPEDFLK